MINVEDYIPLVHKLANREYKKIGFRYSYEDLFQTGCVGLMKAAKSFDEAKGCKFSTYAYRRILSSILNYVRDDKWFIAKDCRTRLEKSYAPTSLNILVGEDKDTPLIDFVEDTQDSTTEIKVILDKLPCILSKIIKLRYFCRYTQKEISEMLNIPMGSIRGKEKKALQILREELMAC